MTRKDFQLIAAALRSAYEMFSLAEETAERHAVGMAAQFVAQALVASNPRFDLERFMTACGVGT